MKARRPKNLDQQRFTRMQDTWDFETEYQERSENACAKMASSDDMFVWEGEKQGKQLTNVRLCRSDKSGVVR